MPRDSTRVDGEKAITQVVGFLPSPHQLSHVRRDVPFSLPMTVFPEMDFREASTAKIVNDRTQEGLDQRGSAAKLALIS